MESRILGEKGENAVVKFLEKQGCVLITANFHSRYGEVDIILEDEKYIIFVEVKTRKIGSMISGSEAVDLNKQNKIIKTAMIFLGRFEIKKQPRFDVAEVNVSSNGKISKINYIKNAFEMRDEDAFF